MKKSIICFTLLLSFILSSCNNENVTDSSSVDLPNSNTDSQNNSIIDEDNEDNSANNEEIDNEYPSFSEEYIHRFTNGKLKKEYSDYLIEHSLSEAELLNSIVEIMKNVNTFDKVRTEGNEIVETIDLNNTIDPKQDRLPQNILGFAQNYAEIAYRYAKRARLKENVSIGKLKGDKYTTDFKQEYIQDENFDKYIKDLQSSIDSFINNYMEN